jgi:uncharacterized protein
MAMRHAIVLKPPVGGARYIMTGRLSSEASRIMRERIQKATKEAAESQDKRRACTLRLISAAIKDRDQASREKGCDNICDEEVVDLLAKMVRQRQVSAREFEEAGRVDEAEEEREEIAIIREFLPPQLDETAMRSVCRQVVDDIGAAGLRDVGRAMTELKQRYPGQMDFGRASCVVKSMLR